MCWKFHANRDYFVVDVCDFFVVVAFFTFLFYLDLMEKKYRKEKKNFRFLKMRWETI